MSASAQNQSANFADAPKALRDAAEQGTAQAKENLEKVSAAAGQATQVLQNTYASSFRGAQDYGAKVLEFAQVNGNAAFEYARQLAAMKSPAEFLALANAHMRQQYETLSRQAQELAAIAQKSASAAVDSVKENVNKPR